MRTVIMFFAFMVTTMCVYSQNIVGDWFGVLSVQAIKLHLVFHISQTDNGYSALMDSPDQGAKGMQMSSVEFENQRLTLKMDDLGIVYTANVDNSDSIVGTFTQMGQSLPLILKREAVVENLQKYSQEPTMPYPYHSEDVKFFNIHDSVTLAGTLTFPNEGSGFPAVVLVSGSGKQNRDEELLGHKPFLVLSDFLTRNGIAVLRYDDRGSFQSTGDFSTGTIFDFTRDAEAAVNFLRTRKEINSKEIGVVGHSEGGIVAPLVAVNDADIAFIVLLAGPGIKGDSLLILQQKALLKAGNVSDSLIENNCSKFRELYSIIENNSNLNPLKDIIIEKIKSIVSGQMPNLNEPQVDKIAQQQYVIMTSPWMRTFLSYDPASTLEKVRCRVLAINGSKDCQVPSEINLSTIETALNKGGNKNYKIKELSGLNHLFQECKIGLPNEYAQIEQTISPRVLKIIADWIVGKN